MKAPPERGQTKVRLRRARLAPLFLLLTCVATSAAGQENTPTFELSFSNPGARSMGFGGAFVALADDATAAFANPAGLVQLLRPEFFFELRARFTTEWSIDQDAQIVSELTGLSFLSFVYPRGDWAVALNGHRMASFELEPLSYGPSASISSPGMFMKDDPWPIGELDVVRYALSLAYRASDSLALGIGVSYFKATLDLRMQEITLYPTSALSPQPLAASFSRTARDTDTRLTGGFLWSLSERWRLAGFYRAGPQFAVANDLLGAPEEAPISRLTFPETYGLGAAYRSPNGALTLALEWDRVEYSSFLQHWHAGELPGGRLALDDGNEFHVGGEYAFLKTSPLIAVRAGAWSEPDHQIHYSGTDAQLRSRYPEGGSREHWALGFGLAFKKFQFDLGFDLSEPVNAASFSLIWSF